MTREAMLDRRRTGQALRRPVLAVFAAVLALAGCGGGGSKTAASSSSPSPTSTTSTTVTSTTASATGQRGLTGIVTILAGNGSDDGKGVPGPATEASLGSKVNYAVAGNGDLYITTGTTDVLKVAGGQVSVFASLDASTPGTGGIAISPTDGSIYVASPTSVVKFAPDGTKSVVVTTAAAGLSSSLGPIAVDGSDNLYVADGSRRITRVGADGSITPYAGTDVQAPHDTAAGDGGPATASPLNAVTQMAVDASGNLFFTDTGARRVRRIAVDGTITTIAGGGSTALTTSGAYAPDGTNPTDLNFLDVEGVAVDGKGRVYVADGQSRAIFRFGPTGGIELLIADQKGGSSDPGLPANATRALTVAELLFDADGNLLYLDGRIVHSIAGAAS
jgi:sugar lactone lactonase YvrE